MKRVRYYTGLFQNNYLGAFHFNIAPFVRIVRFDRC